MWTQAHLELQQIPFILHLLIQVCKWVLKDFLGVRRIMPTSCGLGLKYIQLRFCSVYPHNSSPCGKVHMNIQQESEHTSSCTPNWFIWLTIRPWSLRSHTQNETPLSVPVQCNMLREMTRNKIMNKKKNIKYYIPTECHC